MKKLKSAGEGTQPGRRQNRNRDEAGDRKDLVIDDRMNPATSDWLATANPVIGIRRPRDADRTGLVYSDRHPATEPTSQILFFELYFYRWKFLYESLNE